MSSSRQDTPTLPMARPEKRRVGDFVLLRELGRGAMGLVFEARQCSLDRHVALKVLPLEFNDDRDAVLRFHREASAAGRLRHPAIVSVYQVGVSGGTHFYAMELVQGHSLSALVKRQGALALERAVEIIRDAAWGLHHAHERGVVHRDIKPSNLLITCDGQVKVADFGLARVGRGASLTATGMAVGTPRYMAPEQAQGFSNLGPAVDIYALGATLYELVTGEPAFDGDAIHAVLLRVVSEDPTPARLLRPGLPVEIESILQKAMAKQPDNRYGSAAALGDDLDRWLAGEPVSVRPEGKLARLLRNRRGRLGSWLVVSAACSLGLVGLAVGVGVSLAHRSENAARERIDDFTQRLEVVDGPAAVRRLLEGLVRDADQAGVEPGALQQLWRQTMTGESVSATDARRVVWLAQAALAQWSADPVVELALARALATLGRHRQALARLDGLVAGSGEAPIPEGLVAEVELARVGSLLALGSHVAVLEDLSQLPEAVRQRGRGLLAEVLLDQGGWHGAAWARQVLKGLRSPKARLLEARACDALGETTAAAAQLSQVLELVSEPCEARAEALVGLAHCALLEAGELRFLLEWLLGDLRPDVADMISRRLVAGRGGAVGAGVVERMARDGTLGRMLATMPGDELLDAGGANPSYRVVGELLVAALDPARGEALRWARQAVTECRGSAWELGARGVGARALIRRLADEAWLRVRDGRRLARWGDHPLVAEARRLMDPASEVTGELATGTDQARRAGVQAWLALAELRLLEGRIEAAEQVCLEARAQLPECPELLGALSLLQTSLARGEEAEHSRSQARLVRRRVRAAALREAAGGIRLAQVVSPHVGQTSRVGALGLLARLCTENPWNADAWLVRARFRGREAGRLRHLEQRSMTMARSALADYTHALADDPGLVGARVEVAILLSRRLSDHAAALDQLRLAAGLGDGDPEALYELGKVLHRAGGQAGPTRHEVLLQAERVLQAAAARGHPKARRVLQEVLRTQGRLEDASVEWQRHQQECRQRLLRPGGDPEAVDLLLRAQEMERQDDHGQALRLVEAALARDARQPEALRLRAGLRLRLGGGFHDVLLDQVRAVLLEPDLLAEHLGRPLISGAGGLEVLAEAQARRAVELAPEDPAAYVAVALTLRARRDGDPVEVRRALQIAHRLSPGDSVIATLLALVAMDELRGGLDPARGSVLAAEGGVDALLDIAEQALNQPSVVDEPQALSLYARSLVQSARGNLDGARRELLAALDAGLGTPEMVADELLLLGLQRDPLVRQRVDEVLERP